MINNSFSLKYLKINNIFIFVDLNNNILGQFNLNLFSYNNLNLLNYSKTFYIFILVTKYLKLFGFLPNYNNTEFNLLH